MPIGKNTRSVQAYVTPETKKKIQQQAKQTDLSESKVAGLALEKHFSDDVKSK